MLSLTNPQDHQICFKVRTTAPKRYSVRPNNGVIEGQSTAKVMIFRQGTDSGPSNSEPSNSAKGDRFMIQSMATPSDPFDADLIWKAPDPGAVRSFKLRAVLDVPTLSSGPSAVSSPVEQPQNGVASSSATRHEDQEQVQGQAMVQAENEPQAQPRQEVPFEVQQLVETAYNWISQGLTAIGPKGELVVAILFGVTAFAVGVIFGAGMV
jgi:vesicle-associated membrane protein-associated protein B